MIDPQAIIRSYKGVSPTIADSAYIAPGAVIMGDVTIGEESSVWPNCVLRGDVMPIAIGSKTNIQDGTVIHCTRKIGPTNIGSGITIGHQVMLHACTLEDDCFIGMKSMIMDFASVASEGMVAAGAMVTPNKRVETHELWAGSPAKHFRAMTQEEIDWIPGSAAHYWNLAQEHALAIEK